MSQFPNYNIIPADIIINTVTNLENLNLFMLNNVYKLEEKEYLVSTFRLRQGPSRYMALVTSKLIDQSSVPEFAFFSVNYNEAGVLSANTITLNATDTLLTNLKGNLSVVHRSKSYRLFFETPDLDNIRQVKESICALHSFPNKTFVINGTLVLSFSFVKDFFILTYMGFINDNPELKKVDSLINYDYANGTLLVRFESQPFLLYNTKSIQALNLFPDIEFKSLKISTKSELITGGMYDYIKSDEGSLIQSDFLSRIVYASTMNYTADNIEGNLVDFTPLSKKIQISESAFIIAFTNVLDEDTTIRRYATLLVYSPSVPNFPIVTTFIPVTLTEDCEDFIDFNGIKFKFIGTDAMLLCSCELKEALCKNKASIPVADMIRYEIVKNNEFYDSEENKINALNPKYLVNKNMWEVSDDYSKKGFNMDTSVFSKRGWGGDSSSFSKRGWGGDTSGFSKRGYNMDTSGFSKRGKWSDKYYNNNNESDDVDRPIKNKILF